MRRRAMGNDDLIDQCVTGSIDDPDEANAGDDQWWETNDNVSDVNEGHSQWNEIDQ